MVADTINNGNGDESSLSTYGNAANGILKNAGLHIVQIVAAPHHYLVLTSDGGLWGWGNNNFGQLGATGASLTDHRSIDVSMHKIPFSGIIVAMGGGGVYGTSNQNSELSGYTAILRTDGSVQVNGSNAVGGTQDGNWNTLIQSGVVKIACGYNQIFALKNDGTLWGWGNSSQAGANDVQGNPINMIQPNSSSPTISNKPVLIATAQGKKIIDVATGWNKSAVLYDDGTVQVWGSLTYTGRPTASPQRLLVKTGMFCVKYQDGSGNHIIECTTNAISYFR